MDSLEIGVGGASFCLHLQAVVTGGLCSFVRAMATYVERKEQVATWDGNQSHWLDYVKRVRLQYERTPFKKRQYLGAELVTRLTGKAWDVASADIDHDRLQASDGPAYLLQFLEQRLCKAPVPDSGQRLEDFFHTFEKGSWRINDGMGHSGQGNIPSFAAGTGSSTF